MDFGNTKYIPPVKTLVTVDAEKNGGKVMGEQITPDAVGTEVGVRADLLRGHPIPREVQSQEHQLPRDAGAGSKKEVKLGMAKKIKGRDKD